MGNTPNDHLNNTLLVGPIDTKQELELIFELLHRSSHLRRRAFSDKDINDFLVALKNKRSIEGSVDTVDEIVLLLDMMRQKDMLIGPIDTPEEIRIFMQSIQAQGYLPQSISKANQTPQPVFKAPPIKKQKKHRDTDEDDELDDDDNNPDTPRPE